MSSESEGSLSHLDPLADQFPMNPISLFFETMVIALANDMDCLDIQDVASRYASGLVRLPCYGG